MAFAESNLLLTEKKLTQLTAALANTGVDDPLATCIAEATADVARLTAGFILDEASTNGFIRALALFKAYSLCGSVPDDVDKQYDNAMKELNSIARGERPNLPRVPEAGGGTQSTGGWGSQDKITT